MTLTKSRIDRIAYIGWRGVEGCEVLNLDSGPLTGLVGPTGAGKSTLTMCLGYALLPDRKALDIRPISEVKDVRKAGVDMLAESIDPRCGHAYVALDITTRSGDRLIAGIYVESIDGRAEFTRWVIRDPKDMGLYAIMAQDDGEGQIFPAFQELRRHCAGRGIDVSVRKTVGEYCQALYDAGILPSGMSMGHDRSLYASLIETTFKGGVSNAVVSRLKDFLLPEATQVSDIVAGLQACTNEVIMTRNEISSAEKELTLLQSTYGVGKEIVIHSLRWLMDSTRSCAESLQKDKVDMQNQTATQKQLLEDVPLIKNEIAQTEETKKAMLQAALTESRGAADKVVALTNTLSPLKTAVATAKANKSMFDHGRKQWQEIAGQHTNQTVEWVRESLENRRKAAEREAFSVESEMERLQKESIRLNGGMASALSEKLAEKTGGQTLENALSGVSEQEALSIELALCGLTEGVVGVDANVLSSLPASEDLPDTFWLGQTPPEPRQMRATGDWYVTPSSGGYVATKKNRTPVFGGNALETRRKNVLLEIDRLRTKHEQQTLAARKLESAKTLLATHREKIDFYIAERDNALKIDQAVVAAEDALKARETEIKHAEEVRNAIDGKIQEIEGPYDEQLKAQRANLNIREQRLSKIGDDIKKLEGRIAVAEATLLALNDEAAAARAILGNAAEPMLAAAEALEDFSDTGLLVEQTKRISALGVALQDEMEGRLSTLQNADPSDRLSTLKLWPVLTGIVKERVSIDCAELDGEDMIQAMKEHRAALGSKLVGHENEVRISARNLHQTISSQTSTQKRKIDKLSKLGESVTFGNVTGIRIVLLPRYDMLTILEGFADQLFSEKKPVDVALKEWFDAVSGREDGISMSGEELLDYRNYVDLSIEACRKGSGWAPAVSLSGGESIGSGLALALMLTRSIATKGEIKIDQITPLFAVDEAHRLDSAGHAVVVDFARREGFQVVVAAPELTPSYSCILYSLNRVFDPHERLIIRGCKVTPP